jgi:glutamate-5-semialdehyde dehydrogenase
VARAQGPSLETQAEGLKETALGEEWEWEESPEVSLCLVPDVTQACSLFNRYSPRFVASLLSSDSAEQEAFYQSVDAPFVCDDMTRWVDGQFALRKPELGLSNWQRGRLFARGGILTGDAVYTLRTRASGKP